MSALLLLASLLFSSPASSQSDAFNLWLDTASTLHLEIDGKVASDKLDVPLMFKQDFSGEVVILSAPESPVFQTNSSFKVGNHSLSINKTELLKGKYLLLLHDFNTHDLQTITLVIE